MRKTKRMIYEKKNRNWKRVAVIAVLAFSLAVAWVVLKPLLKDRYGRSRTPPGTEDLSEGKREEKKDVMDRMDRLEKRNGYGPAGIPGKEEVKRRMDALQKAD